MVLCCVICYRVAYYKPANAEVFQGGAACASHAAIAQAVAALQKYGISPSAARNVAIKGKNGTNVPYLSSPAIMACPPYVVEKCAYIVRVRNMEDQMSIGVPRVMKTLHG